ncbi:MAG: anaerobic ribonucleoside-triphosphate reductase activating protein [Paraclostridium sp.]
MRIAQMRKHDIANGPGIRATMFVSGCTHDCKGCFNKEYQDFNYGEVLDGNKQDEFFEYCLNDEIKGISILGGEPMQQGKDLAMFIKKLKFLIPEKTIWVWTGFLIEDILDESKIVHQHNRELLKHIDVLVDGKFEEELKDINLKYCGSSNQRIIDVQETLKKSKVVLYDI